jgi:flagellar basal-body rod protein FlgC
MGFFDGYNLTTSGMSAQRTRINTVSANIANAQTTHTENGGPYKKQNVVFEEIMMGDKAKKETPFSNKKIGTTYSGVSIKEIADSKDKPIMKFEPNHPDANEKGYVAYPNINPVVEMVDLIEAMRSYEANVSAFTAHKQIDNKTLDILKG